MGWAGENKGQLGERSDQGQHETTIRQLNSTPVGQDPPSQAGEGMGSGKRTDPHHLASRTAVPASRPPAGSVLPSAVEQPVVRENWLGWGSGGEAEAWGQQGEGNVRLCSLKNCNTIHD